MKVNLTVLVSWTKDVGIIRRDTVRSQIYTVKNLQRSSGDGVAGYMQGTDRMIHSYTNSSQPCKMSFVKYQIIFQIASGGPKAKRIANSRRANRHQPQKHASGVSELWNVFPPSEYSWYLWFTWVSSPVQEEHSRPAQGLWCFILCFTLQSCVLGL